MLYACSVYGIGSFCALLFMSLKLNLNFVSQLGFSFSKFKLNFKEVVSQRVS